MQAQKRGQYIIETPVNDSSTQEQNAGDKQDEDQDDTTYERMEQCEEFDFDKENRATAAESILTNSTEDTYKSLSQEWERYLHPTQGITEIIYKLPTIRELWQLLPEGPDKNTKIEMLTQEYQALEATPLRRQPGDNSEAVKHTIEQVERQYHTLVSQFNRNHADTGLQPPPLHV